MISSLLDSLSSVRPVFVPTDVLLPGGKTECGLLLQKSLRTPLHHRARLSPPGLNVSEARLTSVQPSWLRQTCGLCVSDSFADSKTLFDQIRIRFRMGCEFYLPGQNPKIGCARRRELLYARRIAPYNSSLLEFVIDRRQYRRYRAPRDGT